MLKKIFNTKSKWFKWIIAAFAMLFFSIGTLVAVTTTGYSATSLNTGINGLSAEYDTGTWAVNSGIITGSIASTSSTSCGTTTYTTKTAKITFKNTLSNKAKLTYSASVSSGGSMSDSGAGNITLEANSGSSLVISFTSDPNSTNTVTLTISSIDFIEIVERTITFNPTDHGSYTVNGTPITASTGITSTSFAVVATPDSGYYFGGWYNATSYVYESYLQSDTLTFTSNATVYPVFIEIPSGAAQFLVGSSNYFYDLNVACSFALNNSESLVKLSESGNLASGSYTIPAGITLLIPFDSGYTLYTSTPTVVYNSYTTPTAFRTLTMLSGANITVRGAICCCGQLSAKGQMGGYNGTPTGPDGRIDMKSNSSITLLSGAKLYVWGYIIGSGSVVAESGSTVYEAFQIKDWRGGTATSNVYSYAFIFSQYYIQNIEVPLTIKAGATESLYSSANASSRAYPMSATLVGTGGLFNISTGYMIKDYIEATDRIQFDIYGNASVTSMTISGIPMISSINTSSFIMPITSNMTIHVHSGTTTSSQDFEMLPSAELIIDDGSTFKINSGKKVYVYDNDDWGNFTGSARLYVIGYSVANGTTAKRTASTLTDAKINVNGTLDVTGKLYTSLGGANITSSLGSGKVILNTAADSNNSTIYEMEGNSTKTSVTFNPARLHNWQNSTVHYTSNEYVATAGAASKTTYSYHMACDEWYTGTHSCPAQGYTITWVNYDDTVLETDELVQPGVTPTYDGSTPTKPGDAQHSYTFAGWTPSVVPASSDATYKAVFTESDNTYTITWKNWNGDVLETDSDVPYGTTPTYDGATPTRPADAQYTYTFSTWSPTITSVTGNAEYVAQFTQVTNSYTITWKNWNGDVLETDSDVPYGTTPTYDGATPTRPADAQYTYTFSTWSPTITSVTGNAEYVAQFSQDVNKYTITWQNYDGTVLETDLNVPYGTTPSYDGATPTKPAELGHVCNFVGWSPAVSSVTGDAVYTAEFDDVVNTYTITWKNYDGTTLEVDENVSYGATPSYDGSTPTKPSDAHYTYTFSSWSPEIVTVTGNATYTAQYSETINTYTITWKDDDGTVLETDSNVPYGTTPTYDGSTPTKTADAQYTYSFTGWSPAISSVTGDAVYTATYSQTVNTYTITWKDDDGTILQSSQVAYGVVPTYEGSTPTKAGDSQYTYTFAGWSPSVVAVTGNATYTATYNQTINTYTITWKNWNGDVLETDSDVPYGTIPTYDGITPIKTDTGTEYFVFAGWSPTISSVTGDATYTATFTTFDKISVVLTDGVISETLYVIPGSSIDLPTEFGDSEYTLKKWSGLGVLYNPGDTIVVNDSTIFTARYGGWFAEGSNMYYVEYSSPTYTPVTGLYSIEGDLYYFNDDGAWQSGLTGFIDCDSGLYYLQGGQVINYGAGLIKINGKYYYFGEDGRALTSGTYYISDSLNGLLPAGTYTFNSDGSIQTYEVYDSNGTVYIKDGFALIDGIKVGYGLFQYNGNYYYAKPDGTIVTSGTYFVSVTNGLYAAGLYYFDSYGHMYSAAFVPLTY